MTKVQKLKNLHSGKSFKVVISFFGVIIFTSVVFVKSKIENPVVEVQESVEIAEPEITKTEPEVETEVLAINISTTPTVKPQVKISPTSLPTKTENNSSTNQNNQIANVQGVQTTVATPAPTVTALQEVVNVEIKSPDGNSTFSVEFVADMNVCDSIFEAKEAGKISSYTLDNSYMASMKSLYVKEINGYKDNWTFTVNGTSPLGCSLITLKPNDIVVWNYN